MEEKRKIYEEKISIYHKKREYYKDLLSRKFTAKENIIKLQEELEQLKNKRPVLLAENKNITKLNNRMKVIENEIEINNDLIKGIEAIEKDAKWSMYLPLCEAQDAYQEFIQSIINNLKNEYMEVGQKFAKVAKEYITLEEIRDGIDFSNSIFPNNFKIPNVKNTSNPLLCGTHSEIESKNSKMVHEKYNIPVFNVSRISYHDFK